MLEARSTGLNTRAKDLVTVKFKDAKPPAVGSVMAARFADPLHIVLHSDSILGAHDPGVCVFD